MLGSCFLAIILFLNIANIGGRYLFRAPVKSTYELTGLFMITVLALGWPYTTSIRGHVYVDVLTMMLPKTIQNMLDILNLLIGLVFFIAMTWGALKAGIQYYELGSCSDLLRIPYLPFYLLISFGAFLVSIIILLQFFQTLNKLCKGEN